MNLADQVRAALEVGDEEHILDAGVALAPYDHRIRNAILEFDKSESVEFISVILLNWLSGAWDREDIASQVVESTWAMVEREQGRARVRKLDRSDCEAAWYSHWEGRAWHYERSHDLKWIRTAGRYGSIFSEMSVQTAAHGGTAARRMGRDNDPPATTGILIVNGQLLRWNRHPAPRRATYGRVFTWIDKQGHGPRATTVMPAVMGKYQVDA